MVIYFLGLSNTLWGHTLDNSKIERLYPEKVITAVRVNSRTLNMDGILDDEGWQGAPITTGLVQKDPNHGEPATEKTTIQVVYDDEALYIGVTCYDDPDKIVSRLGRRDQAVETDRVNIEHRPTTRPSDWLDVLCCSIRLGFPTASSTMTIRGISLGMASGKV